MGVCDEVSSFPFHSTVIGLDVDSPVEGATSLIVLYFDDLFLPER